MSRASIIILVFFVIAGAAHAGALGRNICAGALKFLLLYRLEAFILAQDFLAAFGTLASRHASICTDGGINCPVYVRRRAL